MTADQIQQPTKVDRFAWERGLRDERIVLKSATVGLLHVLAAVLDASSGSGFASQPSLAKAARMGERTVRRHLELAIAAGVLVRTHRGHRCGDGVARASTYQATLPPEVANDTPSSDFSTGQKRRVEKSQPAKSESQPAKSSVSTGQQWPPINPREFNPSPQDAVARTCERVVTQVAGSGPYGWKKAKEMDRDRLERIVAEFPTAPVEMLASAALGEPTPYISQYRRDDVEVAS